MNRFVIIGRTRLNVEKIRSYWFERRDDETIISVEMDNGAIYRCADRGDMTEKELSGENCIVQVIPTTSPLYVRYDEDGKIVDYPLNYLGLCADGQVRPLSLCEYVDFADDACNFLGIYEERYKEG